MTQEQPRYTIKTPYSSVVLAWPYDAQAAVEDKMSKGIKAVLFDWDGTLTGDDGTDVYQPYKDALEAAMLKAGYERTNVEVPSGTGLPDGARAALMYKIPEDKKGQLQEVEGFATQKLQELAKNEEMANEVVSRLHLREGVKETFTFLEKNKIPFAIVSNSPLARTQYVVDKLFKREKVSYRASSNVPLGRGKLYVTGTVDDHDAKPDPYMLNLSAVLLGQDSVAGDRIFYVGDNVKTDVYAALNAGFCPVLIGKDDNNTQQFSKEADAVIRANEDQSKEQARMVAYVANHHDLVTYLQHELGTQQRKTSAPSASR